MKLQTTIPLEPASHAIDYHSHVLLLGSCFSENMAEKFRYYKFQTSHNPFGILFHPKAIEIFLERSINSYEYTETDIFYHQEQWHYFNAHSKLSNASKVDLLDRLNAQSISALAALKKATHIIVTLGTAWVYVQKLTAIIVANCHKLPQQDFDKILLEVDEIYEALQHMLKLIRQVNTNANVIFTVSPVRHLKDGFVQNMQSKAHLITAIHKLNTSDAYYFPSYEIMMDELRDYRFYAEDMIHPNKTAVNYIWKRFKNVWLAPKAYTIMDTIESIQRGMLHKPFNPKAESHQTFLKNLELKKADMQMRLPHITFD